MPYASNTYRKYSNKPLPIARLLAHGLEESLQEEDLRYSPIAPMDLSSKRAGHLKRNVSEKELVLEVETEAFVTKVHDHSEMGVEVVAEVLDTAQIYSHREVFQILRPSVHIEVVCCLPSNT